MDSESIIVPDVLEFEKLRKSVQTVVELDFAQAQGYTLREKFASIYAKTVEVTDAIKANGVSWIVTCPEIGSMFETCANFEYFTTQDYCDEIGFIKRTGIVDSRWHLYLNMLAPLNEILIVVFPEEGKVFFDLSTSYSVRIDIKNLFRF